jgi:hypothetical protein
LLKALSVSEGFREFGPEILENSDETKETHENSRDGELLRARSDPALGGGSTDSINRLLGLHPGGEDLSPTVQASSSYFSFSGYFICYISMLLPAGVRGEPKAAF